MAATTVDPEILVDAFLMHVEDLGAPGRDWLQGEFTRVLRAVIEGDEFVASVSFEGHNTSSERSVNAKELLALLTECRRRLPNADGLVDDAAAPAMLIPRFSSFPL